MTLAEATPEGYREKSHFQIPEHEPALGVTSPVISNGRLFLRDNDRLHCFKISDDAPGSPQPEPRRVKVILTHSELRKGGKYAITGQRQVDDFSALLRSE